MEKRSFPKDDTELTKLTPLICKIMGGKNLAADEAERIATALAKEETEGYYTLAFNASMLAKGLTENELYGLVKSLEKFSIQVKPNINPNKITDLSGSGGDRLKTFNISTAASFVVAGAGVYVAKQAFKSFTSPLGASEILEELGINLSKSEKEMRDCLKTIGIVPLFYLYLYKGLAARLSAYKKLKKIGLKLPTPFHPIAFIPHPFKLKRRIYGLAWKKYLWPVANIFKKLNYEKVLVFHGLDGLDEISNIGPTKVLELNQGNIKEYAVTPEDLGVRRAKYKEIESGDKLKNIKTFLKVLYNKEKGAKEDIVVINAAASFYVMEKVDSLKKGVNLARKIISEGKAAEKLEALVKFNGNPNRLNYWKTQAGI